MKRGHESISSSSQESGYASSSQSSNTQKKNRIENSDVITVDDEDTVDKEELISHRLYFNKISMLPNRFNCAAFSLNELLETIRPIASIHFNFMIDLEWLLEQYPSSFKSYPITLVVGQSTGTTPTELKREAKDMGMDNVHVLSCRLPIPYGVHHTKLSIFEDEKERIHVIVSTANLVPGDWDAKTQMFYYMHSEMEKERVEDTPLIVNDLIRYLECYKNDDLSYWCDRIRLSRFPPSSNRIVFSYPGYHKNEEMSKVGHLAVRSILSERNKADTDPVKSFVCQASSIGSLGNQPSSWLGSQFTLSMRGNGDISKTSCHLIYPTVDDVKGSIEGYMAGTSLPYKRQTSDRQEWLNGRMCKWRSEKWGRSRAMPHVKTYTQFNSDRKIDWQIVTSANLSKAAWGEEQKNGTQLMIRSYECGVLIMDECGFRLPYDYPIAKYKPTDKPWIVDDIEKLILEDNKNGTL